MNDPKLTILTLLEDGWNQPWTPNFTADWYDQQINDPQIIITHLNTRTQPTGFTENPSQSEKRHQAVYMINVWSTGDETRRWTMIDEVERIINSKCDTPGGDLEFIEVSGFRDLDELDTHPRLYRSQLTLEVLYYG